MKKNDLIIAQDKYYSLDCYETQVNNNVLVVGTSGSGKTRSIVSPNILQAYGSYVISDPKGNLYGKYKEYLEAQGYEVQKLDFINPVSSAGYNFFQYIRKEQDVLKIAHMLTYGHTGRDGRSPDPFWDQATELLLSSLIGYLWQFRGKEDQNLESVLKLISACDVHEENSSLKTPLDRIMEHIFLTNPTNFAVKQYQRFRMAAGKTLKSILITVGAKLAKFDLPELNMMLKKDEIDIPSIGQRKKAVFVVVSDTDRSMDDLVNLFFTQAMNELCTYADTKCEDNRLPVDVRFFLDDFATNCCIDEFPRMIASIRSRGISAMLMIQAESQLTKCYGHDGNTIIGNCDTYIYLGGNDLETAKAVAERCDVPLKKILYMPVGTNWIFRRGEAPVNGVNFKLDSFQKEKMEQEIDR